MFHDETGRDDCSYWLYFTVFRTEFNLAFGSPKTDVCSFCYRMKNALKLEKEQSRKGELKMELDMHRRKQAAFFKAVGLQVVDPTVMTICFDLMQTQPLPKTNISESFYSRQIWQYIFGVIVHYGKGTPQNRDDIYFYTWGEHEMGRGSNEIVSCLYHFLRHNLPAGIRKVRLFSDSCAGQNKNRNMLAMLQSYSIEGNITFEYYFPIRGHSYLPADRAFGRVEKLLRKRETILTPQEYHAILRNVGNVKVLGTDFHIYDWGEYSNRNVKTDLGFKISRVRVVEVDKRIHIRATYSGYGCDHNILKRGRKWLPRCLRSVQVQSHVSREKNADVVKLLQSMGITGQHPSMEFYRTECKINVL